MNDKQWKGFDEDVDCILEQALAGTVDKKMKTMTGLMYAVGNERFGLLPSDGNENAVYRKNRRQTEIEKLRKELRSLRSQYRKASELERIGLHQIRDQLEADSNTSGEQRKSEKPEGTKKDRELDSSSTPMASAKKSWKRRRQDIGTALVRKWRHT